MLALSAQAAGEAGRLLFRSGFEHGVRVEANSEGRVTLAGGAEGESDWTSDLPGSNAYFVYLTGKENPDNYTATHIEQVTDRHGQPTRALYMSVTGDYPGDKATTRNEFSIFGPISSSQGYARHWMKYPADLVDHYPPGSWRMLMEWKEPDRGTGRTEHGGTNNWRMNINLRWDKVFGQPYWMVQGQQVQPLRQNEWTFEDRRTPVPQGEWFLVEVFWRKHPVRGRLYFAVNGEEICDYQGRTEHAANPLPLKFWSVFKNYHGRDWLEKGPTGQWVDDLEIWSDFPPGHPKSGGGWRYAENDPERLFETSETLFEESFDLPDGGLPAEWWGEGSTQCGIREGRLYVNATPRHGAEPAPQATLWLDREFSGDLQLDFDVHVVSAENLENNVNLFFLFSDPSGAALRSTSPERKAAAYRSYHGMNGYIFTYLANGAPGSGREAPARLRFRDLPGFDNLLYETYAYEVAQGKTYHVTVRKIGPRFLYSVDGRLLCDRVDDKFNPAHQRGSIGLRTWRTELWWDNIQVRRLHPR